MRFIKQHRAIIILLAIGFVGGFLWLAGLRFFIAQPEEVHYHANFAVNINGQREEFSNFTYYEEVAACTTAYADNPKGRTHLHDQINDVIHVHDSRVTYGNFFDVLGWGLGENYIAARDTLYTEDDSHKLTFILNGEEVEDITNQLIGNLDKLLVTYGSETNEQIQAQYQAIGDSAEEKNKYQDPSSCSGLNGAGHDSFGNKLKRATFWP